MLKDLYKTMLSIRMIEEYIADEYAKQEMRCPMHLSIGQEAVAAGVCSAIEKKDFVFSNHRSHAHYLAKGGDLPRMIAELYGKQTGCASGKGGSMHLVDKEYGFMGAAPIVGSTIPVAVGTAFSAKLRGEDRVTVVFFGEGAVETGVFYESLNFAVLHQLPVLFVCENNLYSVYSPLSVRQPVGRRIIDIADGIGVDSEQIDGNDVGLVYQKALAAIADIRDDRGPAFLECMTYRWREHCGPNFDNSFGYRSQEEFETWQRTCPIESARRILEETSAISEIEIAGLRAANNHRIEEAFAFALNSPYPDSTDAFTAIYAS